MAEKQLYYCTPRAAQEKSVPTRVITGLEVSFFHPAEHACNPRQHTGGGRPAQAVQLPVVKANVCNDSVFCLYLFWFIFVCSRFVFQLSGGFPVFCLV